MKRYLTIFAAVCAVFASCHPDDDATTTLKVSEDAISLAATDANDTFTVTASAVWTVTSDADWLTITPSTGNASNEPVTVTVTADDNDTPSERPATITISAGELTKTIEVTQIAVPAAPVVNFTATGIGGIYYADGYMSDGAASIISLMDEDETKIYNVVVYTELGVTADQTFTIPAGTYTLSSTSTIAGSASNAYLLEGEDDLRTDFVGGTVTITADKVELSLTTEAGVEHNVVYNGAPEVLVYVDESGDEFEGEMVEFEWVDATIQTYPSETEGYQVLNYYNDATGEMICLEVSVLDGEFQVNEEECVYFLAGTEDYTGSYYSSEESGAYIPFDEGFYISISKDEDGTTNIVIYGQNADGPIINGVIIGTIVEAEE